MGPSVMTAEHGFWGSDAIDRRDETGRSVINGAPEEAETTDDRGGVVERIAAVLEEEHRADVFPGVRRQSG